MGVSINGGCLMGKSIISLAIVRSYAPVGNNEVPTKHCK